MNSPVGVLSTRNDERLYLFFYNPLLDKKLVVSQSDDGLHFKDLNETAVFIRSSGLRERFAVCSDFRFTAGSTFYYAIYKRRERFGKIVTILSRSKDCFFWKSLVEIKGDFETTVALPDEHESGNITLFIGDHNIRVAVLTDMKLLTAHTTPILTPRHDLFDNGPLQVASAHRDSDGIHVLYYSTTKYKRRELYNIGMATLDKHHVSRLMWRSEGPIWQQPQDWRKGKLYPIGVARLNGKELYFWTTKRGKVFSVSSEPGVAIAAIEREERPLTLERLYNNPIIKPKTKNKWESKATFNPAAVHDKGKVHVLYRAIGDEDVSSIGYAASKDGVHFDERHNEPCYSPRSEFEGLDPRSIDVYPGPYSSGGGVWGGCEDPKVTKLGDRFYMLYVAYDGRSLPRLAMTSIHEKDFDAHHWNWTDPVLISRPGVINKSGCLLSEKIDGKFVIFHRIFPDVLVDYIDDLGRFDGKTFFLKGEKKIPIRKNMWDAGKLSVGAPPIKTSAGWLVIYHATTGRQEWHGSDQRYKIGAMLLDLEDPTLVLARSRKPILEPIMCYENEGHKAGVAYPCGAVVKNGDLFVYYGGADTVVCAARAKLKDFLDLLTKNSTPQLVPVRI